MYYNKKPVRESVREALASTNKEAGSDKQSKIEANYSPAQGDDNCGGCTYFILPKSSKPDAEGACELVKGAIDRDMWCKLFEVGEDSGAEQIEAE
jgi:hypothetical protein